MKESTTNVEIIRNVNAKLLYDENVIFVLEYDIACPRHFSAICFGMLAL